MRIEVENCMAQSRETLRNWLWIDFKLYFYVRTHKRNFKHLLLLLVVNWFQIVFLREDSQVFSLKTQTYKGCELISNCIFTWGLTSKPLQLICCVWLWIDFKLYFYVRTHKRLLVRKFERLVVNWFQIVFLREDSQETNPLTLVFPCCELISNCIFTWGLTRRVPRVNVNFVLWIDFKLYFYVRTHKVLLSILNGCFVVNWFQIVFLREDSQVTCLASLTHKCCELISNCIFTWGLTRDGKHIFKTIELWIDFKLYFYVRTHKHNWNGC